MIQKERESLLAWTFSVCLKDGKRSFAYTVEVSKRNALVELVRSPRALVQESMIFLLEHESPEAILPEFNLKEITSYFPEYESAIKERIKHV